MTDISGLNLKEPEQINWDDFNQGGKYQAPPIPLGPDGKPILFIAQVTEVEPTSTKDGYLAFSIQSKLAKNGSGLDGIELRDWVNVKSWKSSKTGEPLNINSAGIFLRSCGILAKPNSNAEYLKAATATKGKTFCFTADWSAYSKDTQERIDGYLNFPEDPEFPGRRKAILKAGDTYTVRDRQGNITDTKVVQAEVMFANLRVNRYVDPTRK